MAIRRALMCLVVMAMAGGCAGTLPPVLPTAQARQAEPVETLAMTELPPQSLEVGECAVFFWGGGEARAFLAYENFNEGVVRIFVEGGMREFASMARAESLVPGLRYERRFTDPSLQLDIELAGDMHGGGADGLRIAPAILRLHRPDDQQVVIPVTGHYACRINP